VPARLCLFVLLLAVASLFAPTRAIADDLADEADLHFRLAAEAYQQGDYRKALQHFLASNRLVPNRNVVFNIARTYERLAQYPEAYRYFDQALHVETDAEARVKIQEALSRIRPNVAVVRVETTPAGATVYLERRDLGPRGTTPRALGVHPGTYRVIAELPGYYPAEGIVRDARLGVETTIRLDLKQILGQVRVEGSVGAEVRVDDPRAPARCRTPCVLQLSPGPHRVLLELAGHHGTELPVTVLANRSVLLRPSLVPLTGSLVVNTDEPGALVEVDDRPRGFTPAIFTLPVGTHQLTLSRPGYRAIERTVRVKHARQLRLTFELAPLEEVQAASRISERIEDAPSSVTVIPRLELQAFAYPTIAEAVRGVPGVYLWDDRAYVSVGIRGLGRLGSYTNRLLVLQDGVSTNDNWVGSAFVAYDAVTDLGDVERIEVVRGPGSALYGTGAFSGVVSLVTRRDLPTGVEGGVSTNQDSVARARVRADTKLGRHGGAWASVAGARSEGRDFFFPEYAAETPPGGQPGVARGVDGFRNGTARGHAWWRWVNLQWFWHRHSKQLPGGAFETLFGDPRSRQVDIRGFAELRAEPKLSEEVALMSRMHWNQYRFRGGYPYAPGDGGLQTDTFRGQWVGVEQRLLLQPAPSLRFTLGGEGQLHYLVEQRARDEAGYFLDQSGPDAKPYQVGAVYAVADGDATDFLRLSLGARLDSYSTFGSSLNPRAAIILRSYDRGTTKLLGGTAFRAPSIYELYYNDGGFTQIESPNLSPESVYSVELEHSHRFSTAVTGTAAAYSNYVRNLIDVGGSGDAADPIYYFNAGTPLLVLGTELTLRRDWRQGWMVAASYGFSHARFLASPAASDLFALSDDPEHRRAQNVPAHSGSLKGAVPLWSRRLVAASRLTLEGPRWDRYESIYDPPQQRTDSLVVWDLILSGQDERRGLEYALGVYNLFDWHYALPVSEEYRQRSMPQLGRTLLASVSVRL
jgi:outer membrane receptor protein involved in Fe transport